MTAESPSRWDADSLRKLRLIGDRRYRRMWGAVSLAALAGLAAYGGWGVDFGERPIAFFLGFWAVFFGVFIVVLFFAALDLWSVRLEYVMQRRDLVHDFLQSSRADTAPRNGDGAKPPPRL